MIHRKALAITDKQIIPGTFEPFILVITIMLSKVVRQVCLQLFFSTFFLEMDLTIFYVFGDFVKLNKICRPKKRHAVINKVAAVPPKMGRPQLLRGEGKEAHF